MDEKMKMEILELYLRSLQRSELLFDDWMNHTIDCNEYISGVSKESGIRYGLNKTLEILKIDLDEVCSCLFTKL
jgi:hypothetical protein